MEVINMSRLVYSVIGIYGFNLHFNIAIYECSSVYFNVSLLMMCRGYLNLQSLIIFYHKIVLYLFCKPQFCKTN